MADTNVLNSLTVESDDQIRARCLFITQLRQHVEKCEREENYLEADRSKKRLAELQQQDRYARVLRLKERHRIELDQLETVMQAESAERREAWREKQEMFESKMQDDIQAVKQKQQDRRIAEEQVLMQKFDTLLRPSKQLQEYRRQQQQLVRLGRYKEAEQFRVKGDALEQLEVQKQEAEQQNSIVTKLANFDAKLAQEMVSVQNRFTGQRALLNESMNQDFLRIQKKQDNIRKQLVQVHSVELLRIKKAPLGLPFIVDDEGNDLITTPDGLNELLRVAKETMGKEQVEPQSLVKAYRKGILTVRPGDVYYSLNTTQNQQAGASQPLKQSAGATNTAIDAAEDAPEVLQQLPAVEEALDAALPVESAQGSQPQKQVEPVEQAEPAKQAEPTKQPEPAKETQPQAPQPQESVPSPKTVKPDEPAAAPAAQKDGVVDGVHTATHSGGFQVFQKAMQSVGAAKKE